MSSVRKILSACVFFIAMAGATAVGYLIVSKFGLPVIPAVMLSAVTGTLILFIVFGSVMSLLRRSQRNNIEWMHHSVTEALNEMANGNFNVLVETDPHTPHNDIAEAMNEMARKLGTLENMRQDFVSNISHEIQSPLTSIGGFAKLLKESASDEQSRHYAEVIIAESRRLSSLSDNLLKLSTLDNNKLPLNRTDFRLDKQLETVALTLEPQWSAKNITLEADLLKSTVNGDEALLSQVWINLLVNAIKFTPEGGTITITMNDGAVTVADTGCGIPDEDRPHIFERFYKVDKARDRSRGGNGLGLAIVKKITELHGGHISVESDPGKGTTFEISLPGLHSV